MKLTIWGINYAPEETGIGPFNTGLCEFLAANGHDVRMISTFSYYPQWEKTPGDRRTYARNEIRNGVRLRRRWHYVPRRPTALKRMLHEASFALTGFLALVFDRKPDLLVVVSPPLILGPFAWLASRLRGFPYTFHVQDMQPDAALRMGMLQPGKLSRLLYALERFNYRHAASVTGITHGMLDMFTAKGLPATRQAYFPNWTPDEPPPPCSLTEPDRARLRQLLGTQPGDFLVFYSGNLGKKQGLEVILDAAEASRAHPHLRWIIAGNGAERASLEATARARGLANLRLLPLQPTDLYRQLLAFCNLSLVTQRPGSGALFFPSKLLTILRHGCAVITVAEKGSELARAMHNGQFGRNVEPGDAPALANAAIELAASPETLPRYRQAGRNWVAQFRARTVLPAYEQHLKALSAQTRINF